MQEPGSAPDVPPGARCARHPEQAALVACARCGDYACTACTHSTMAGELCASCHSRQTANEVGHYGPASRGQRFVHLLIDQVAVVAITALLAFALALVGLDAILDQIPDVVLWWSYYLVFEGAWGVTLGKVVTRTRVVTVDGSKPNLGQIALRSVIRVVPFDGLSFLLADTGWHDTWSKTRVVRATAPDWLRGESPPMTGLE